MGQETEIVVNHLLSLQYCVIKFKSKIKGASNTKLHKLLNKDYYTTEILLLFRLCFCQSTQTFKSIIFIMVGL